MSDNKKIRVTELDFDQIKENFKNYLKGQQEFTDYNLDSSALSVILDVLAYNTHYNAIYANLIANEMFLDSASKRNSVVSLAKQLGYTPQSVRAARASLDLFVIPQGSPSSIFLPKLQPFTTIKDGRTYTFYNKDSRVIVPVGNVYVFNDLEIIEGTPLSVAFEVENGTRFVIANSNVDLSTLTVEVQESADNVEKTNFVRATSINNIRGDSPVFYVQEIYDGLYEIKFGDGVIGKPVVPGNIVRLNYFVTNGDRANSAKQFTFEGSVDTPAEFVLILRDEATGGAQVESIESIKFRAPLAFATQNRAVTAEDYKNIILTSYPDVDAVSVWGGEDNDPPVFGRVFLSIKPKSGEILTEDQKLILRRDILGRKGVIGIEPIFIDPEYLYLTVSTIFFYDPASTNKTEPNLLADVRTTIQEYNQNELEQFGGAFRYSKLLRDIDNADTSISNNRTTISMYKEFTILSEAPLNYIVGFGNSIIPGTVITTAIRIPGDSTDFYLQDDTAGNILLFTVVNGERVFRGTPVGFIDYLSGTMALQNFSFSLSTGEARVYATPRESDIAAIKNQLLRIRDEDIFVQAVPVNRFNNNIRTV
jgi:hypothetical protein